MANKMRSVVIRRRHWVRGGGDAALRTGTGQSCCLGFAARACGLRTPSGSGTFSDLLRAIQDDKGIAAAHAAAKKIPTKLRPSLAGGDWIDSDLHEEMVATNDDSSINPKDREKKIAAGLRTAGLKVVFED